MITEGQYYVRCEGPHEYDTSCMITCKELKKEKDEEKISKCKRIGKGKKGSRERKKEDHRKGVFVRGGALDVGGHICSKTLPVMAGS